jgi:phosphatidylinositol alpha-mannosyltransferase
VVASSIEGYDEVITDGVDGLLVPPRNPEALADAITQLCRSHDLRERMGRSGLEKAEEYSWERVGAAIERYYDELLQ